MKITEKQRTIILIALLVFAIGFIIYIQTGIDSNFVEQLQLIYNAHAKITGSMNDEQNNQQPAAPGQTFQPQPQPAPQPMQPQQPVPQPQQPTGPPQPMPQQPTQNPYVAPQQQPQFSPQQLQNSIEPLNTGRGFSLKKLFIATGLIVVITIVILAYTFIFGSGLSRYSSDEISFSVGMPSDWNTSHNSLNAYDQVIGVPNDVPNGDQTNITVTRERHSGGADNASFSNETSSFIANTEGRISDIEKNQYKELFNVEYSDVVAEKYGRDEMPAYRVTYSMTDLDTKITYNALDFYLYETPNTSVRVTSIFSPTYQDNIELVSEIVSSYSLQ